MKALAELKREEDDYMVNMTSSATLYLNGDLPAEGFGPNCWNATMVFHQGTEVRHVKADEMEEWLLENTTVKGYMEEVKPEPGDILIMRGTFDPDFQSDLVHTAVYLGHGMVFHKAGCVREPEVCTVEECLEEYDNYTTNSLWASYEHLNKMQKSA
jgi:hypothetical protein